MRKGRRSRNPSCFSWIKIISIQQFTVCHYSSVCLFFFPTHRPVFALLHAADFSSTFFALPLSFVPSTSRLLFFFFIEFSSFLISGCYLIGPNTSLSSLRLHRTVILLFIVDVSYPLLSASRYKFTFSGGRSSFINIWCPFNGFFDLAVFSFYRTQNLCG